MALATFRQAARPVLSRSYVTVHGSQGPIATSALSPSRTTSSIPAVVQNAIAKPVVRMNWTRDEVRQVYETPLSQLTHAAVCFVNPLSLHLPSFKQKRGLFSYLRS